MSILYICTLGQHSIQKQFYNDNNEIRTNNHLVFKATFDCLAKRSNDWAVLWLFVLMVHLTLWVNTECNCSNVKEPLARNRRNIWKGWELSGCRLECNCCQWIFRYSTFFEQEASSNPETIECHSTLKLVPDMTKTYRQFINVQWNANCTLPAVINKVLN